MIKEAYCNYEISELLKEKGFDEKVFTYYEDKVLKYGLWFEWNRSPLGHIAAPTHQMACAWLREVHNIFIEISTSIDLNGNYHYSYSILNKECKYVRKGYTDFDWNYEDAMEAALKYTLENLI